MPPTATSSSRAVPPLIALSAGTLTPAPPRRSRSTRRPRRRGRPARPAGPAPAPRPRAATPRRPPAPGRGYTVATMPAGVRGPRRRRPAAVRGRRGHGRGRAPGAPPTRTTSASNAAACSVRAARSGSIRAARSGSAATAAAASAASARAASASAISGSGRVGAAVWHRCSRPATVAAARQGQHQLQDAAAVQDRAGRGRRAPPRPGPAPRRRRVVHGGSSCQAGRRARRDTLADPAARFGRFPHRPHAARPTAARRAAARTDQECRRCPRPAPGPRPAAASARIARPGRAAAGGTAPAASTSCAACSSRSSPAAGFELDALDVRSAGRRHTVRMVVDSDAGAGWTPSPGSAAPRPTNSTATSTSSAGPTPWRSPRRVWTGR